MTFFSAIPVPETTVGIAIESERGKVEPPKFWLPVSGPKYKPDQQMLPDEGLRGSMVQIYEEIAGLRYDSHGWDQHPYLDTFPVLLRALLGSKDKLTPVTPTTELVAEAKVADKKILVAVEIPEGTVIVLGEGTATEETRTAGKPTKIKVGEWETPVVALTFVHLNKATVTYPTELLAEAKAGATEIKVPLKLTAGDYIVIGEDTALVTKVTEVGPTEFTLKLAYPLSFTHAAKAVVTGLTGHSFSLLNNSPETGNQPPSCTLVDYGGEFTESAAVWRALAAAQLNTLNISGAADALPKVVTDWFANASVSPSENPEPSFSSVEAPPGWTVKASIGGTQVGYLVNWELDLKRNVKNVPAITGTKAYYQHFAGALDSTVKVTVLEDPAATWLSAYEAGSTESFDLTLSDDVAGIALNLHSSKAKFLTGNLDRSKEWVEVALELQLLPTTADALAGGVAPIVATVANNNAKAF